jgi:hypothetical protein
MVAAGPPPVLIQYENLVPGIRMFTSGGTEAGTASPSGRQASGSFLYKSESGRIVMRLSDDTLVDVHAHICDAGFDRDREKVLARARHAGVGAVVAVGENLSDARKNLDLAATEPFLKPAAGLYPTYLDQDEAEAMVAFIRTHRNRLVAIGEVGLDYWAVKEEAGKALQRKIFRRFVDLSRELQLPLNVHSRSAGRHAVALLRESGRSGFRCTPLTATPHPQAQAWRRGTSFQSRRR